MKREQISWEKVRAVCIVKTMAKAGHFPKRETEKEAWFLSPFRPETHTSLKVSKIKNLWFDHGVDFGENVLDLVVRSTTVVFGMRSTSCRTYRPLFLFTRNLLFRHPTIN